MVSHQNISSLVCIIIHESDKFFEFYKNEMLNINLEPTQSSYVLAAMERAGKLQCVITSNIYENPQKLDATM